MEETIEKIKDEESKIIIDIAQKLFHPKEKLIKAIQDEINEDIETTDDMILEFQKSLDGFIRGIINRVIDKIEEEHGEFDGFIEGEYLLFEKIVHKMCLDCAKERGLLDS